MTDMKINIVKIIDTADKQLTGEWSCKEVAKRWTPCTLYQIEKREILEIQRNGKHVRYLMKNR